MKLLLLTALLAILLLGGCKKSSPLAGIWTNGQGQTFAFDAEDSVMWLFDDSSGTDTFRLYYRYDAKATPPALDLFGFETGQLKGQTLFGIATIGGAKKDSLRLDFEMGTDATSRPKDFNPSQSQTFVKVPSNLD
jgi:hypothetical protein